MKSQEFLLEIGVEEIPHWMIPGALTDLESGFQEALEDANLRQSVEVSSEATPRRLVLVANGVPDRQADREETLKGPPRNVAFDVEGNPTKAAEGFAKRSGLQVEDLETGDDGRLVAKRLVEGRQTSEILAEALPAVILGIHFPRAMYWRAKTGARFIRPIRWLVALLGGQVVEFWLEGVRSGNHTFGHRRLGTGEIVVSGAESLREELRAEFVILSSEERRQNIEREAAAALPAGKRARPNPDLLETLVYLTEYPTPISGDFDPDYLRLPPEVLETVMLHHQKYFAVEDENGKLAAHFVAVANLDGDPDGVIRQGHERVLRARFSDAQFFWETDQKKRLGERVEDLNQVTFHARLGSYHDKTLRNQTLVKGLAEATGGLSSEEVEQARRAAELAKCDLTTGMVGGVSRTARHHRRDLRRGSRRIQGSCRRDLRSLQTRGCSRQSAARSYRPNRGRCRQAGHSGRNVSTRNDTQRIERSIRSAPCRVRYCSDRCSWRVAAHHQRLVKSGQRRRQHC